MLGFWTKKDSENLQRVRELLELAIVPAEVPAPTEVSRGPRIIGLSQEQMKTNADIAQKLRASDSVWEEDALEAEEVEQFI